MTTVAINPSRHRRPKDRLYWLRLVGFTVCAFCFLFQLLIHWADKGNYAQINDKSRLVSASLAESQVLSAEQSRQLSLVNSLQLQLTHSATPAEGAQIVQQLNAAQAKLAAMGQNILAINNQINQENLDYARADGAFEAISGIHQDFMILSIGLLLVGAITGIYAQIKILQVSSPWAFGRV